MKTDLSYRNKPEGNACVPAEMLWDYLEGKLTAKQQHQVEAHLLDCPMCTDALEGFQQSGNRAKVTQLNADIIKQVTYRSSWYLSAAAASVVLVAAFGLLWWGLDNKTGHVDNVAQQTPLNNKQETISAASPEERGPGSPEPDLNRPSSDGMVALPSPSRSAPSNVRNEEEVVREEEAIIDNAGPANDGYKVAVADGIGENISQNPGKSDKELHEDVVNSTASGAGSSPSPSPAPTSPSISKPAPAYRDRTVNNKAAKSKQASPAAEAAPKKASLAEGMYYYNNSNFPEAIKIFKDVLNDDPANQEARYYLGMSYKNNGDKSKALDELTKVGATCLYYDDALWNRSLLLIEAGRKEEAKPLLQKLVDGKGKYAQQAMGKLGEL